VWQPVAEEERRRVFPADGDAAGAARGGQGRLPLQRGGGSRLPRRREPPRRPQPIPFFRFRLPPLPPGKYSCWAATARRSLPPHRESVTCNALRCRLTLHTGPRRAPCFLFRRQTSSSARPNGAATSLGSSASGLIWMQRMSSFGWTRSSR
jgi:hypothetical protein